MSGEKNLDGHTIWDEKDAKEESDISRLYPIRAFTPDSTNTAEAFLDNYVVYVVPEIKYNTSVLNLERIRNEIEIGNYRNWKNVTVNEIHLQDYHSVQNFTILRGYGDGNGNIRCCSSKDEFLKYLKNTIDDRKNDKLRRQASKYGQPNARYTTKTACQPASVTGSNANSAPKQDFYATTFGRTYSKNHPQAPSAPVTPPQSGIQAPSAPIAPPPAAEDYRPKGSPSTGYTQRNNLWLSKIPVFYKPDSLKEFYDGGWVTGFVEDDKIYAMPTGHKLRDKRWYDMLDNVKAKRNHFWRSTPEICIENTAFTDGYKFEVIDNSQEKVYANRKEFLKRYVNDDEEAPMFMAKIKQKRKDLIPKVEISSGMLAKDVHRTKFTNLQKLYSGEKLKSDVCALYFEDDTAITSEDDCKLDVPDENLAAALTSAENLTFDEASNSTASLLKKYAGQAVQVNEGGSGSFIPGGEMLHYFPKNLYYNVIQTASQFNGLESTGPDHSPLYRYAADPTQGPTVCGMSREGCVRREVAYARGTLPDSIVSTLDYLVEKGVCTKNDRVYRIKKEYQDLPHASDILYQNGYLEPARLNEEGRKKLALAQCLFPTKHLSQEVASDNMGEQSDVPFTQVFASAYSYQYPSSAPTDAISYVMNYANLVSQYENMLKEGIRKAMSCKDKFVAVHFTGVGAGAFNNPAGIQAVAFWSAYSAYSDKLKGKNIILFLHGNLWFDTNKIEKAKKQILDGANTLIEAFPDNADAIKKHLNMEHFNRFEVGNKIIFKVSSNGKIESDN